MNSKPHHFQPLRLVLPAFVEHHPNRDHEAGVDNLNQQHEEVAVDELGSPEVTQGSVFVLAEVAS